MAALKAMKRNKAARLKAQADQQQAQQAVAPPAQPAEAPARPPVVEAWADAAKPAEEAATSSPPVASSSVVEAIMCLVATLDDTQLAETIDRIQGVSRDRGCRGVAKVDYGVQVEPQVRMRPRPAVARHEDSHFKVAGEEAMRGKGEVPPGVQAGFVVEDGNVRVDMSALNSLEAFF